MLGSTYDTEDNGSGYPDEIVPGKKAPYHSLNNIKEDDIAKAFQEETGTDESGLGEGDDDTWDDAE